jgi:hypothetical protein
MTTAQTHPHTHSPTRRMGWAFPACLLLVLAVLFAAAAAW